MKLISTSSRNRLIIKKCHKCGHIMESKSEIQRCSHCNKAFLPSNYHNKLTAKNSLDFYEQFLEAEDLCDENLIKGIQVLW